MGFMANMKGNKAYNKHRKGEYEEAKRLYAEALADGMDQPRFMLSYAILLLRSGEYQKARELLVKTQKAPGLLPDQRIQLFTSYAAAVFRLGELDKGIDILEKQHIHKTSGILYQTLGYLYVEKYDRANQPDFDQLDREAQAAAEAAKAAAEMAEDTVADDAIAAESALTDETPVLSSREKWQQGLEKARVFIEEAVEYDDEDAVCLDNMAQFYDRVLGDRATARIWYDKAIAIKPGQIDTLWFLAQYDLEEGKYSAAREKLEKALEGRFSPLNFANRKLIEEKLAEIAQKN